MAQSNLNFERKRPAARALEIGSTGTSRFGGRLRPEEYSPDWGIPGRYDKIRRMMNDADVGAAIDQIVMPLEAAPWEVVPGDDSAEAVESAALIQRDLIDDPAVYSWEYVLEHALQAPVWGSMLFEPVWRIEGGQVRLEKLAPRMPHTVQDYFADDAGILSSVVQYTNTERGVVTIPAEKLVAIVYRMEGSDYTGRSLLRRAYKPWWMKAQLEDIDGISAEKHGMGVDVVNYDADATDPEDLVALKASMRALHVHQMQHLTLPNGMTYEIKAPSGTVHDVKGSIKHHQQMIFRALLADMMGMGEGRLGSHGLSEDKTSVLMLKLVKLGKSITEPLNVQLIGPWHRWNYGPDVPAPYIKHGRIDTRDLQGFVEAAARGVEAGVLTPNAEVEAMVREIGGLAQIEDGERESIQRQRRREAQGANAPLPFVGRGPKEQKQKVAASLPRPSR